MNSDYGEFPIGASGGLPIGYYEVLIQGAVDECVQVVGLYEQAKDRALNSDEEQEVANLMQSISSSLSLLPPNFMAEYADDHWESVTQWSESGAAFPNGYNPAQFAENILDIMPILLELLRHIEAASEPYHRIVSDFDILLENRETERKDIFGRIYIHLAMTFGLAALATGIVAGSQEWNIHVLDGIALAIQAVPLLWGFRLLIGNYDRTGFYFENIDDFTTATHFHDMRMKVQMANIEQIEEENIYLLRRYNKAKWAFWIAWGILVAVFTTTKILVETGTWS